MGYVNVPVAIGWMAGSAIAGDRYERMGDKINLAKKYMMENFSMSQSAVDAIPRSEVVAELATKLSKTPLEVQSYYLQLIIQNKSGTISVVLVSLLYFLCLHMTEY